MRPPAAPLRYADLLPGDIPGLVAMIRDVFFEFMAPAYTEEGIAYFLSGLEPAALSARLASEDRFMLVAKDGDILAGAVEVRGHSHISLLFTAKDYHRRGIAKELVRLAVSRCREALPSLTAVTLNSSAFALPVYQRLGFRPTGPRQERNRMVFTPMALKLASLPERKPGDSP